ncbi:cystathionine beta-lyase [Acinetobacter calcoaceticus]|uniref:Cystathionine beta-lyase n=1 Tax=Acinetobacter calcoaceticus TaxID=471 RepID=A0A4R1Y185_ACICA|nr:cystathionine beta-lyase [Acinetobacter calcoaceticus]
MKITPQTALIHAPRNAPQSISTVQPPLYRASTIIFQNTAALYNRHWTDDYDYSYGTHGTPTTYTLADQIALNEGGKYCLLAPSGLSAINLINSACLGHGDEVWIPDNIYGPNKEHLHDLEKRYGIGVQSYNCLDIDSFQPSVRTKLIWLEAAGSVSLEFPDIHGLLVKAKQHGVLTALDNTWGAGLAFNPFDIGDEHLAVDISVHALTKYPSGGGDILMGAIVTRDLDLHHRLLRMHALQGIAVSGDDVAQIQRSLSSMRLRYQQHHQTTQKLSTWLTQQSMFAQVLHPMLPDSPGHVHWKQSCSNGLAAGLVSVIFKAEYNLNAVRAFCDQLQLFKLGFSWGGPMSLVMLYQLTQMRQLDTSHLAKGILVRFCIGLEHPDDLIQDIAQALEKIKSSSNNHP